MTIIFSGQSRPSQKPRKARNQPLAGGGGIGLPVIMVFLCGLILTIVSYSIMNIFINPMIDDSIRGEMSELAEHINEKFDSLEKELQLGTGMIALSSVVPQDRITREFQQAINEDSSFQSVHWLHSVAQGQYAAYKIHDVTLSPDATKEPVLSIPEQELHKIVIQAMANESAKPRVISPFQEGKGQSLEKDKGILILAMSVQSDSQTKAQDIIYAIASIDSLLPLDFFAERKNIYALNISLKNGEALKPIFSYNQVNGKEAKEGAVSVHSRNGSINLFDTYLSLKVSFTLSDRELYLQKVPLFLLLFGIVLTGIGTYFVFNNQKQSYRLAFMNKELLSKNDELSREISEREKLNLALRKAEKENRSVIDSVSDIIFETSTSGQILFLNETWQKITGFSTDRSLGRNIFDLLYMQDQTEQKNNFALLVKGKKQAYRAFTRLRTSDGTFRAVELAVSMLRQDENREMRVVGTITDVEERRRAERALSEAEKKFRAMVENAASGIYQVTPEGHYLSANPAMANILGYDTPEDFLKQITNANIDVYVNPTERERSLRDVLRDGSVNAEVQVKKKSGEVIWVHENLRTVKDDDGQLIYFEGSMDDITRRKETEIALTEAKMQSDLANRGKSEFLANMSHELRTPLNAIIGFSDIIKGQAFGPVGSKEYIEYASEIHDSGKRLLQVINDVLDVSRIEAGNRQLNEGIVDLVKVTASALDMLSPKIEGSKLTITNLIDAQSPRLIGEAHAIKQMMTNLLSNAIKFTPAGGLVTISHELDEQGQFRLSVTDTGQGLTDEELEKAMTRFGQVNTKFSKSDSGTGLGLTLVQSLIALHGGTLELFSQKNIGTTATLIFPAKRVSMPVQSQMQQSSDSALLRTPFNRG
jgi:PAS domain S-box-containing protein